MGLAAPEGYRPGPRRSPRTRTLGVVLGRLGRRLDRHEPADQIDKAVEHHGRVLLSCLKATLGILEVGASDPGPPGDDRGGRNRRPIPVPVPRRRLRCAQRTGGEQGTGHQASRTHQEGLPGDPGWHLPLCLHPLASFGKVRTARQEFGMPCSRVLDAENGDVFGGGHGGPRRVGGRRQRHPVPSLACSTRWRLQSKGTRPLGRHVPLNLCLAGRRVHPPVATIRGQLNRLSGGNDQWARQDSNRSLCRVKRTPALSQPR